MRLILISLLYTLNLYGHEGFLPENSISIPTSFTNQGISQKVFQDVQDELAQIWIPRAKALGGTLSFESSWESSTVNAYAQRFGHENEWGEEVPPFDKWKVVFLGGMARHKEITRDGFSLIVCHELGHHFGGAPRLSGETAWVSIEGQADYFATAKCLRELWVLSDNKTILRDKLIPEALRSSCELQWKTENEIQLCLRVGLAGLSAGRLFAAIAPFTRVPQFDTPDPKIVTRTLNSHPKAQCRLDTYLQGALCEMPFHLPFGDDEVSGACHSRHGQIFGTRPRCWFKENN
jgi:hypothetical protein